jgi:hypothetical protein
VPTHSPQPPSAALATLLRHPSVLPTFRPLMVDRHLATRTHLPHPPKMVIRSLCCRVRVHLHLRCKSLAVGVEHELINSCSLPYFFSINLTLSLLFLLWLTHRGSAGLHWTKKKRNGQSPPDHGRSSSVPMLNPQPRVRSLATPGFALRPFLCGDCGMNFARTQGESDPCRRNSRT